MLKFTSVNKKYDHFETIRQDNKNRYRPTQVASIQNTTFSGKGTIEMGIRRHGTKYSHRIENATMKNSMSFSCWMKGMPAWACEKI